MEILPGGAESHHECHTVEERTVSFTYRCTGIDVINWWGVDGYEISTYPIKFNESNSSFGCISSLTLTLYNVTLDYSNAYTAYPSTNTQFSITGVNLTVHLSELNTYVYVHSFVRVCTTFLTIDTIIITYVHSVRPEVVHHLKSCSTHCTYICALLHRNIWKCTNMFLLTEGTNQCDYGKFTGLQLNVLLWDFQLNYTFLKLPLD